jgi:putative transposase
VASRRHAMPSGLNDIDPYPRRKRLSHDIPSWVSDGSVYFITICASPRGQNQLCHMDLSGWIWDSLQFRQDRSEWWVHLALLMPDHMHGLFSFARLPGIRRSIGQWKKYVARERGIVWQDGFFDHRLRNDESFEEKAHYIRLNPVRAGLVQLPEEWLYVWPITSR